MHDQKKLKINKNMRSWKSGDVNMNAFLSLSEIKICFLLISKADFHQQRLSELK